jgi:hypothetical protein
MKKILNSKSKISQFILIIGLLFLANNTNAQVVSQEKMEADFEKFMKNKETEFQNFKDEKDKAIAEFLKQKWVTIKQNEKKTPVMVPIPPVQPKVVPAPPKQDNIKDIPLVKFTLQPNAEEDSKKSENINKDQVPKKEDVLIENKKEEIKEEKKEEIKEEKKEENNEEASENKSENALPLITSFSFFNVPLTIHYEDKMLFQNNSIDEKGVSEYWTALGQSNYPPFLNQVKAIGKILQFNDWGYYELIHKISSALLKNENDQNLFTFFMLSHLKYDIKVGKRNDQFILLMPFENEVYKKGFTTINDRNYYIMGDDSEGSIYTFKQSFAESNKPFDLNVIAPIRLGKEYDTRDIYIKKYDTTIKVDINKNLVAYNNEVPMSELSVFFGASMDPKTEATLLRPLSKLIENKNELEAVNIILDFVQNSFEYKTDRDQFGYEKFFYPEDIFYYKFSDCEDRAILFSHLVTKLLHLEVVGLEYKTHVAAAVKFNSNINGDAYMVNDKKFTVCDPTYLGASAGMTMPQFVNETPAIVKF